MIAYALDLFIHVAVRNAGLADLSWQGVLGEQTAQVIVTAGSPVIVDFTYRPEDQAGESP